MYFSALICSFGSPETVKEGRSKELTRSLFLRVILPAVVSLSKKSMLKMVAGIVSAVVFVIWSAKNHIKNLYCLLKKLAAATYLAPSDTTVVHVIQPGSSKILYSAQTVLNVSPEHVSLPVGHQRSPVRQKTDNSDI